MVPLLSIKLKIGTQMLSLLALYIRD